MLSLFNGVFGVFDEFLVVSGAFGGSPRWLHFRAGVSNRIVLFGISVSSLCLLDCSVLSGLPGSHIIRLGLCSLRGGVFDVGGAWCVELVKGGR